MIQKIALLMFAVCVLGFMSCSSSKKQGNSERQDRQTNSVETPADSSAGKLKSEQGLPLVIDFYATWCGPCRQFKPVFERAADKFKGEVEFMSIDVDEKPEIAESYDIRAIPTIIFADAEGNVIDVQTGALSADQLENIITTKLLK